ncbi:hypothetical protein A2419_02845 [Candidatus Adlerbacteria bacterium RIFOXYC1_FULL_48_26]|uniref:Uncharacterized protein n=1 Tax=Candidatus Adlerbacteria bacterium RIFOXYC1_FULL_48_26 TaxID=1797247 RepID=A0A1F4Y3Q2_9BACT|nr:MAG: hypothetical protein A2419_02845 [Candidatus Adlerbacteria bacterium RIFOXYC1_FULL_48_26]OGC93878.1 MAG: hypothetical protein A2389_00065 [Candidatus Adlerbacteria bacterium RIFOXYB1_FULL_48_10]
MSDSQVARKTRNPHHAIRVLFNTLKNAFEPAGTKPKFRELPATVSFTDPAGTEPHDRFKGVRVNLTLDQWQTPLSLKLRGLATFAPEEGSGNSLLSMVCEIPNGTMKGLRFHDPNTKDSPEATQTKLHQVVLVWETAEGFKARISRDFLERYSRQL